MYYSEYKYALLHVFPPPPMLYNCYFNMPKPIREFEVNLYVVYEIYLGKPTFLQSLLKKLNVCKHTDCYKQLHYVFSVRITSSL